MDLHPIRLVEFDWSNSTGHKLLVKLGVNSLRLHLYASLIELGIIPVISTQFEWGDKIQSPRSNLTGHKLLVKLGVNSLRLNLYACLYIVWQPGQIWWS